MTRSQTSYPHYDRIFRTHFHSVHYISVHYIPSLSNTCSACTWIVPGTIDPNY